MSTKPGVVKKVWSVFKSRDIYGHPVGLEFNGSETYSTNWGTVCTILTGLFIIGYLVGNLRRIIVRENDLTANLLRLNEYANDTYKVPFNVSQYQVDMMYSFQYQGTNQEFISTPQKFINVQFVRVRYFRYLGDVINIEQIPCADHQDSFKNASLPSELAIVKNFTCFNYGYLDVEGTYGTENVVYYSLEFTPCTNKSIAGQEDETCASPEEIDEVIANSTVKVVFITDSFLEEDFSDYPVERTPKVYYFNYQKETSNIQEIAINKVSFQLQNSWLSEIFDVEKFSFYDVSLEQKISGKVKLPEYPMLSITLRRGFEEFQLTRRVSNMTDLLSELGGLLAIILPGNRHLHSLVVQYLLSSYVKGEFQNQILKKLFKYQSNMLQKKKSHFNNKVQKEIQQKNSSNPPFLKVANSEVLQQPQMLQTEQAESSNKGNAGISNIQKIKEQFFATLQQSLEDRKPPTLNVFKDYYSWIEYIRSKFCRRENKDPGVPSEKFFQEQISLHLTKEFSVDTILKRIRRSTLISQLTLTTKQQKLLPFIFKNLILTKRSALLKRQPQFINKENGKVVDLEREKLRYKQAMQQKISQKEASFKIIEDILKRKLINERKNKLYIRKKTDNQPPVNVAKHRSDPQPQTSSRFPQVPKTTLHEGTSIQKQPENYDQNLPVFGFRSNSANPMKFQSRPGTATSEGKTKGMPRFKDLQSLLVNDDYYKFNKLILMSLLNTEEENYEEQKERLIKILIEEEYAQYLASDAQGDGGQTRYQDNSEEILIIPDKKEEIQKAPKDIVVENEDEEGSQTDQAKFESHNIKELEFSDDDMNLKELYDEIEAMGRSHAIGFYRNKTWE